jgi:hypothetical protein
MLKEIVYLRDLGGDGMILRGVLAEAWIGSSKRVS